MVISVNSTIIMADYVQSRKRSGAPIEEQWCKKTKKTCQNGRGFYQQPPKPLQLKGIHSYIK